VLVCPSLPSRTSSVVLWCSWMVAWASTVLGGWRSCWRRCLAPTDCRPPGHEGSHLSLGGLTTGAGLRCSRSAHKRCAYTRTSQHTSAVNLQVRHTATYAPGRDGIGWRGSNPGIPTTGGAQPCRPGQLDWRSAILSCRPSVAQRRTASSLPRRFSRVRCVLAFSMKVSLLAHRATSSPVPVAVVPRRLLG
jgi:hypothetical protein